MVLLRDKAVRQLAVRYLPIILQSALPTLQPEALASGIVIEDDQLFLLEGIGWLLAEEAVAVSDRVEHVLGFVDPLLRFFVQLKDEALPATSSVQAQQRYVRSMCHIIACATYVMVKREGYGFLSLGASPLSFLTDGSAKAFPGIQP
jgi:hypothetical protein